MGLILSKTGAEAQPEAVAKPGRISRLLNIAFPALNLYSMGQEYADGRSVGGILGEQAGFIIGNNTVSAALRKLKFPGSGILSTLGGMAAGMFTSPVVGDFAEKHFPIYRNKQPKAKPPAAGDTAMQMQMPPQMAN